MSPIAGLHYEIHGPADAETLILSAGLGGTGSYWKWNLDALAERYRVITYDHRGTGRSDRTLPPDVTVETMADDLWRLMNGLGIAEATIVGHAAGGAIALALALRAPKMVRGLVVVNGWPAPDPHFMRCFETRLTLLRESGVKAYLHAQPLFLYPARWISENDRRIRAEEAEQLAHFQGEDILEARVEALCSFDIEAALPRIFAPTLLVAAQDDMLVPASCAERLAAGLPNATLASMKGGHACNVTEPDGFNRIVLGWLDGRGRGKE